MTLLEKFEQNWMPVPWSGCFLWTGRLQVKGYGELSVQGKHWLAHRLAYSLSAGEIPSGAFVLHRCDIRSCVNPSHLFLGTAKDNMDDMIRKGRGDWTKTPRGEDHYKAVLSESDVNAIRSDERRAVEIASQYGISATHVRRIKRRESWA